MTSTISLEQTRSRSLPLDPEKARSRQRVLFVESYPHVVYGQQHTMLALLEHSRQAEIEPLVAVPGEGSFADSVRQMGIEPTVFPYPSMLARYGGAIYHYQGIGQVAFAWQVARYVLQARRGLRSLAPSAVFCNDLRGLLTIGAAARSLRIPVMIWDKLDRPHGWLDRLQLPLANRTAFISDAVKAKFSERALRRYADRLETIPNGVEVNRFDAAKPIRQRLGLRDDEIVIGLVGSITARKGQDRLLAVIPQLADRVSNLRVLLVGDVSASAEDQAYRKRLPNQDHPLVHFLGMRQDIPQIMKSLDILVAPSRHEGMGRVLVEAMACGKPVVAAKAGGMKEVVVHGETGLLFDGDQPEQLLEALLTLCWSESTRMEMGQAGRKRMEGVFNQEIQFKKVFETLVGLLGVRGGK